MNTNWQDRLWQKEFIKLQAHKPEIIKLILGGARWCWDVGRISRLQVEYEQTKGGRNQC